MQTYITSRPETQAHFKTHDGIDLFYRAWQSSSKQRRGAIVLVHRGHEHSARMSHLVDELELADFNFFGWDARAHSDSPGARGDSPSIATSVRDIQTFVVHLGEKYGIDEEDVFVIAQSVGAVLTATWAHDYAPKIRGMVLASPAFKVKLYVPLARPGLKCLRAMRGNFYVQSYVKGRYLTHDPERIVSFGADKLITRAISVNILLGLYEAAERVVADAAAICVPTQLLISGADWVVHHGPQHRFLSGWGPWSRNVTCCPAFITTLWGKKTARAQ